ncbi:hypothetical protein [Sulfitobacter aestuariivivens]|uniref:Tail fiber domain-containing protein n=1 Tax=Sulfitobacter aestuariivivens TaxID=2766981 RepID=A0A927HF53_9RHOB|nr:hypothetical protein [Sulfitobacter aestuariivivens]MBD3664586.1 hypothetical protein [Sulfitobacter aestuariivivens]
MMRYLMPAFALCLQTTPLLADQVITDDLIVTRDICVGSSTCVDGESFNGEDIKIRSTNPEILFFDTSTTAGNRWRIKGDNDVGFFDSFSIRNDATGFTPFIMHQDAPTSAFVIDAAGEIGIGTVIPESDIHIVGPGSPGIRIEATNGATPEWLMNVGSSGLALFDMKAGPSLPFVIANGAPNNAFRINDTGNVGMGVSSASAPLHVRRTDNTASLLIEDTGAGTLGQMTLRNNGITFFTLEDTSIVDAHGTGRRWNFQNQGGTFRVTTSPAGPEMLLDANGNMTISGTLTTDGSCSVGCDRVFEADYALPSIAEHNAAMWENGYLPNVGPTPEDGPFNVTDKMGRMLNELEHAHIFIGQQQEQITMQADQIAALMTQQAALMARLERLETQ